MDLLSPIPACYHGNAWHLCFNLMRLTALACMLVADGCSKHAVFVDTALPGKAVYPSVIDIFVSDADVMAEIALS